MTKESETIVQTWLEDVYDVHYRNQDTKDKWYRWMHAPVKDIKVARQWCREYGKGSIIGDMGGGVCMLAIPANKFKTTFRIIKMTREIIEASTL